MEHEEELANDLDVMIDTAEAFVKNLRDGYYERSLHEGEKLKTRILKEYNELVKGFNKISWKYALKDIKKGNEENEDNR